MIGKIWRALWHGDSKTKSTLWSIVVLLLLAVAFVVFWVIQGYTVWLTSAMLILFLAFFVIRSTKFDFSSKKTAVTPEKEQEEEEVYEPPVLQKGEITEEIVEENEDDYREDYLEQYNEKALKKLFSQFKVKKDKIPVMIDVCAEFRICQCPAFLWSERGSAHFLLLEEEPRHLLISIADLGSIDYKRGIVAYPARDYESISKSAMAKLVFGNLLPTYYKEGVNEYTHKKNLYVMGHDLMFTNTCIGEVMRYLGSKFDPKDSYTQSSQYSRYFKELHKAKILWKDNVLDIKVYKAKVKEILQRMTDEAMPLREYDKNLEQMLAKQLITDEYAKYFKNIRLKMKEKKTSK